MLKSHPPLHADTSSLYALIFMVFLVMFSTRNATLVALVQVGVIFAGIAASGLWHKAAATSGVLVPPSTMLLYNYGVFGFLTPLAWITGALWLNVRAEVSDEVKSLAFWLGILILVALVAFMLYADVSPCFRIAWHMGDSDDS